MNAAKMRKTNLKITEISKCCYKLTSLKFQQSGNQIEGIDQRKRQERNLVEPWIVEDIRTTLVNDARTRNRRWQAPPRSVSSCRSRSLGEGSNVPPHHSHSRDPINSKPHRHRIRKPEFDGMTSWTVRLVKSFNYTQRFSFDPFLYLFHCGKNIRERESCLRRREDVWEPARGLVRAKGVSQINNAFISFVYFLLSLFLISQKGALKKKLV